MSAARNCLLTWSSHSLSPCRLDYLDGPQEDWRRQGSHGLSCFLSSSTRDLRSKGRKLPVLVLRGLDTAQTPPASSLPLLTPPPTGDSCLGEAHASRIWWARLDSGHGFCPLNQKEGYLRTQHAMISKTVGDLAGCVRLVSETKEITREVPLLPAAPTPALPCDLWVPSCLAYLGAATTCGV